MVGVDDAPFEKDQRDPVPIVGAVFADLRLDGILTGRVERDGCDAADAVAAMVAGSRFRGHVRLVMLQGIAFAGFNVVDVFHLHRILDVPVLVVARRAPDYGAVRRALETRIPGGREKWRIIERLGPMEPCGGVHVQRVGVGREEATDLVRRTAVHSRLPEPLRVAHLVAGAVATGHSRGRP